MRERESERESVRKFVGKRGFYREYERKRRFLERILTEEFWQKLFVERVNDRENFNESSLVRAFFEKHFLLESSENLQFLYENFNRRA